MKHFLFLMLTAGLSGYWIPAPAQTTPQPGEIVITEIMANPEIVTDANGEWIELFNATDRPLLLTGLILRDDGSNRHTISGDSPLSIQPGALLVLAKNGDSQVNGGVNADYVYSSFTLGNSEDQVILCLPDETVIDQVSYGSGWPLASGSSMELDPANMTAAGNDNASTWHKATVVFGAGDKGTPGSLNGISEDGGIRLPQPAIRVFPNPASEQVLVDVRLGRPESGEISLVSLTGQQVGSWPFEDQAEIRKKLELCALSQGLWFIRIHCGSQVMVRKLLVK